ncbi:MAG: Hsp20/alpha crystallin family protein [Acidobacteriota bacterium]
MTTLMTRTPDLFRDSMQRFFDRGFDDFFTLSRPTEEVARRNWMPAVDVRESEEGLTLVAELPGMKSEDVEITLENRVLTLRGERNFEKDTAGETYHRIERSYGTFSRSFTVPSNLRTDEVKASFEDGILTVTLPKAEEAKARKITIE